MVVRSRPSLRFSVRREDCSKASPPFTNPRAKSHQHHKEISARNDNVNRDTNTIRRRHALARSQSPRPSPSPQRPSRSSKAPSVLSQERPCKKAKLSGRHQDPAPTVPAKLPLRSRDSQGLPTTESTGTQTRSRAVHSVSIAVVPPLPLSPASAVTRTTRRSVYHLPVAVDDDVEKRPHENFLKLHDIANDGNKDGSLTSAKESSIIVSAEKRSLRSNDGGSRSKSELAMYFQNYEQILSLDPVKPEFLSADTPVFIVDDLPETINLEIPPSTSLSSKGRTKQGDRFLANGHPSPFEYKNPILDLYQAQIIDLPTSEKSAGKESQDPLTDDVYFKAHRRIERQEKQLRNIEKERAQHEKVQLDRLLDELQGHDWLRVMGISGITDTEKKLYEPKRAFFIKEVSALIEKFRVWKEEEKRRKAEREQLFAIEDEELVVDDSNQHVEEGDQEDEDGVDEQEILKPPLTAPERKDGQPNGLLSPKVKNYARFTDIGDVDTWASHQAHRETNPTSHRKRYKDRADASRGLTNSNPLIRPLSSLADDSDHPPGSPVPQPVDEPFRSFYSKPHLREAAIGKNRRGRNRTAFGQPLPAMEDRDFQLPRDLLTGEALEACKRLNRRLRREKKG